MREFLLELYLKHGEREFIFKYKNGEHSRLFTLAVDKFIALIPNKPHEIYYTYKITPEGLEYLKNA